MILTAGLGLITLLAAVLVWRRDPFMAGVMITIAATQFIELLGDAVEVWRVEARLRWLRRWSARKRLARQVR